MNLIARMAFALITTMMALSVSAEGRHIAGAIVDSSGKPVTHAGLFKAMSLADYVLIGEKHDNDGHHLIESRLIQERLQTQPGSEVVFEMLDSSQSAAITGLSRSNSLDEIKTGLSWPEKGWDFSVYGPLFMQANAGGRLLAGNISKAEIGVVYQGGLEALNDPARFATAFKANDSVKAVLIEQIYQAHCGMQSKLTLAPMLTIQLAKDSSMAFAMSSMPQAMLVAGGQHVRRDAGVPVHLKRLKPKAKTLVVQLLEVGDEAALKSGQADYYWFAEAMPAKNYCADVKGKAAQ